MHSASPPAAKGFFLETSNGKRFCLLHAIGEDKICRGAILFVPSFGEEMNKSRRMIAIQARALAQHGYAVLLIDLYGCGDSEGEFQNAHWQQWKDDLGLACSWLRQHYDAPISLLGLRLGALLALDFMQDKCHPIHQIILWQPVLSGQQFLTQFFRLQLAHHMLAGNIEKSSGTQGIRQLLNKGETVEIAGYEVSSKLTTPIDALMMTDFLPENIPIHWIEIQHELTDELPPARQKMIDFWKARQVNLRLTQLRGAEFWATQEISTSNELVALTLTIVGQA
ncbi:MAG: hydrolase 2, exosortase A system-associated [Cytophaga sp.]|nr:hydrolase 2, exosortase A system-associated [Undibacterium sp.]